MKYFNGFLRLIFLVAIIVFAVSYYDKNRLVAIDTVPASVLSEPTQVAVKNNYDFNFAKDNFEYVAKPKYDYKISGIVVKKRDYGLLNYKVDSAVPYDFCMVWGENAKDAKYALPEVQFLQSQRFCYFSYDKGVSFDVEKISNSHLIPADAMVLEKIKSVNPGDAVEITGRLVDLTATEKGKTGNIMTWRSSVNRTDKGDGACELIYVDDVKILKSAHGDEINYNRYSLWLIFAILAIFFLEFVDFLLFTVPQKPRKYPY